VITFFFFSYKRNIETLLPLFYIIKKIMLWFLILILGREITAQLSSVQVERIEMNPVEPRPGESVRIRCYLKNVDPLKTLKPDILWSMREDSKKVWRIIGNGASITDTLNGRLSGRKESDEVFEIVFRPIQETDKGTIKCELTNTEGQIFKTKDLSVYSPPYISFITPDVYAKLDDRVILECKAEGYPKPVVKWSRLGELSAILFSSKFEITNVGRQHRGTYRCFAESITPINKRKQIAEAFVTVTIDFSPTIDCGPNVIHQISGINADAEISCNIEGYPLNSVRWYFNQFEYQIETEIQPSQFFKIENSVSIDNIKSVLIIRNVNEDNFGGYTIRVEGARQEIKSKTIILEKMGHPDSLVNASVKRGYSIFVIFVIFQFKF
jgi:hypothetical protein